MNKGMLEHANISVADPDRTAAMLTDVFGWHIRWSGAALGHGRTVHVGTADGYLALYAPPGQIGPAQGDSHHIPGGLNHIGVVVEDLDGTEERVRAAGYATHNHQDYEPGRRFYFHDHDGIEFEVVSYA